VRNTPFSDTTTAGLHRACFLSCISVRQAALACFGPHWGSFQWTPLHLHWSKSRNYWKLGRGSGLADFRSPSGPLNLLPVDLKYQNNSETNTAVVMEMLWRCSGLPERCRADSGIPAVSWRSAPRCAWLWSFALPASDQDGKIWQKWMAKRMEHLENMWQNMASLCVDVFAETTSTYLNRIHTR